MRLKTLKISPLLCFGLFVCFLFKGSEVRSQDPLLSMQENTPLMINPALTGSEYQLRGIVNYRTQWRALGNPFTTAAGSFDMALNSKNKGRNDKSGTPAVGIQFVTDKSGNPVFKHSMIDLQGAYHVYFNDRTKLGAGISVGLNSMSLDEESGEWGNQYINGQYNPSAAHGEDLASLQQTHINLGGGVVFSQSDLGGSKQKAIRSYSVGAAFYNAGQMQLGSDQIFADRQSVRLSGFVRLKVQPSGMKGAFLPSAFYHRQGPSQQILFGSYYQFTLVEGSSFEEVDQQAISAGLFYRWNDALIAKVLYQFGDLAAGLAYDVNFSGLKKHTSGRGAIEVMLTYRIKSNSQRSFR